MATSRLAADDGPDRGPKKRVVKSVNRGMGGKRRVSQDKIGVLFDTGNTPVDVMTENMVFWHLRAQAMHEKMEALMDAVLANPSVDAEAIAEAMEEIRKYSRRMFEAREHSQSCAVDLAPYCHPKLAALAIQNVNPNIVVEGGFQLMQSEDGSTPMLPATELATAAAV